MKKCIIKIVSVILLISLCWQLGSSKCFAQQEILKRLEVLKDSESDYNNIVKLKSKIEGQIKIYSSINEEENSNEEIIIDFDNAIKIYTDVDIFDENTEKLSKIEESLKNAQIVWDVMAYKGDDMYRAQISKILPLNLTEEERAQFSESEIQEYEARVGEWDVATVEKIENQDQDYVYVLEKELEKIGENNNSTDKILLCGGLNYIGKPAAIIGDKTARMIIPLSELIITGDKEQIEDIKIVEDENSHAYKYEDIKYAVNEMGEPEKGFAGASNEIILPDKNKSMINTGMAVAVVSGGGICLILLALIVKNKRKKKAIAI